MDGQAGPGDVAPGGRWMAGLGAAGRGAGGVAGRPGRLCAETTDAEHAIKNKYCCNDTGLSEWGGA